MSDVLFLSHRIPFPPNKGDKIRSYRFLAALSERYDVHLGTFVDDPGDWRHIDTVRAHCRTSHFERLDPRTARVRALCGLLDGRAMSVAYYGRRGLHAWVQHTLATHNPRAVFVFSSAMAQFVMDVHGVRRVIDFCDVDSAKWDQYATSSPWPQRLVYGSEGRRLAEFERQVSTAFDASIFISDAEARLFAARSELPFERFTVVRNGVDCDHFDPATEFATPFPAGTLPVVFTGAMDYRANVDAVTEFTRAVLPLLRTRLPNVQFWIVGSKPAREVLALAADAAVHVTGFVSDTRPYLRHAAVVVAPLRMARGMQNKVLEALAIGQPVVATTHVLRGFDRDAVPGMVVADTAETMAQITGDLLASADTARSLGARARAFVYEHFGWRRSLDTLLTVIEGSV